MIISAENGFGTGMETVNQGYAVMLLWQAQRIEDILHLCPGWILTRLLFESTCLEKSD